MDIIIHLFKVKMEIGSNLMIKKYLILILEISVKKLLVEKTVNIQELKMLICCFMKESPKIIQH
jgi:hypothetical protein